MKKLVINIYGKIKEASINDLTQKYLTLTNHYIKTEIKLHKDPGERKINSSDLQSLGKNLILLSEKGKLYDSLTFSKKLTNYFETMDEVNFVIANAYGFDSELINVAQHNISLSPLTFTHEMALVILLEQIYRGLNIAHNSKYHK
jgi:23S rRNA (pseudouridine1915-N3)-methyltransferase